MEINDTHNQNRYDHIKSSLAVDILIYFLLSLRHEVRQKEGLGIEPSPTDPCTGNKIWMIMDRAEYSQY